MNISNNLKQKKWAEAQRKKCLSSDSCLLTQYFSSKGFTLLELIIAIMILAFASLMMIPFISAITNSPDPVFRQRAISLGQALMDEILAKKWDENTPVGGGPVCTTESPDQLTRPHLIDACITLSTSVANLGNDGETRSNFDDVDDYNGLTATNNFVDQSNTAFTLEGYSRSASVTYITSNSDPITTTNPLASAGTTDSKRIVVTVTSPTGETFELMALKCNY